MTPDQALEIINPSFIPAADQKFFETYHILPHRGSWKGDCDNYAVTFGWLVAGRSIWMFLWYIASRQLRFTHVLSPRGVRHLIVLYNGLYYDNLQRRGCSEAELRDLGYLRFFEYPAAWIFLKLFISYTIGYFIPQR